MPTSFAAGPPYQLSSPSHLVGGSSRIHYQSVGNSTTVIPKLRDPINHRIPLEDPSFQELIKQIKEDNRTFMESELKVSMMELKNNLFEQ